MTEQFATTTLEEAMLAYQLGHLTATGLVRFWVKINLKYGWKQKYNAKEAYTSLGISKAAFHKAVATLKVQGFIDFEVIGEIEITNTDPGRLDKTPKSKPVSNRGQESPIVDTCLQSWTGVSNRGQESTIVDERSPKPPSFKASSPPSYSSQINSNSVKVSQIEKDDDDDDDFNSWLKEKLNEMNVNNPSAYLNARDKNTGLTVLEVLHKEYGSQPDENTPKTLSAPSAWQKVLGLSARLQFGQRTNQLISPNDEPRLYQSVMAIGGLGKISAADPIYDHPKLKASFIEFYKNFSDN